MMETPYLCVLYLATAGQQGNLLGADEEEIVLLVYVVIDMTQNKVVGVHQMLVKPRAADANENVLSEQLVADTRLTEEVVRNAQSLEAAIQQFDHYVSNTFHAASRSLRLVTDGQLPLRQALHPEASGKGLELPTYYATFHDLRKEFRDFYSSPGEMTSIQDMVNYLGMTANSTSDYYVSEIKDMVDIVTRLIADGHKFENPETVNLRLEPGICSKDEEVDNNCVVRARGLPWQSSDQDIAKFFRGLNVEKGGVALCLSPQGRRNGEALVRFTGSDHRDMALKRHKHHIGARYIEVYKASGDDFVNVAGGGNNEAQAFLSRGAQVIVRMRGLPYDAAAKQVLEFFESGEASCTVMDGEEGVLFVKKPDGRATGDAFVLFAHEDDSAKALSKHRELIGSRYIELFRSTTAEVQQVLNRSMDPKTYESPAQPPLLAQLPQVPLLPQHVITSGTRKDCIRLRGLPYEAQVEHILDFLGEHAKSIVFQGVHMVYNAQGQPSGEAFIQMDSEHSAFVSAAQKHHRYMIFGKKQRYIEVFQCSGEDMNLVLTGGLPAPGSPKPGLLSPGMLAPPQPAPAVAPGTAQSLFPDFGQALAQQAMRQSHHEGLVFLQIAAAHQQHQAAVAAAAMGKWPEGLQEAAAAAAVAAQSPPPQMNPVQKQNPYAVNPFGAPPPGNQSMFLLNMAARQNAAAALMTQPPPFHPRVPPPQLPPPTMMGAGAMGTAMGGAKRSWEQAFPPEVHAAFKRQWPAQAVFQPPPGVGLPPHMYQNAPLTFYPAM